MRMESLGLLVFPTTTVMLMVMKKVDLCRQETIASLCSTVSSKQSWCPPLKEEGTTEEAEQIDKVERAITKQEKAIHGDGKVEEETESLKKTEGLTLFLPSKVKSFRPGPTCESCFPMGVLPCVAMIKSCCDKMQRTGEWDDCGMIAEKCVDQCKSHYLSTRLDISAIIKTVTADSMLKCP